jgi:lysophospholipase L1-like esterase
VTGLALPLVLLETWAQRMELQLPTWEGADKVGSLMAGHPTRLWGMTPGVFGNAQDTTASINAWGLRGKPPEMPRPAERDRILTLGDSAFFGFGVNDEDVFTRKLEQSLQARGQNVDVLNGGIAGYSIAQHKMMLEEEGWKLDPTLLVLCNLWSDNTWDTFHDEDLLLSRKFASANPLTRSALVKWFASWMYQNVSDEKAKVIVWSGQEGWPTDKIRRVPLKRWVALHDEILREAARRGTGAVFLKPSNTFLVGTPQDGPPPAWGPYFEAMEALALHHGIPVIDVNEPYRKAVEEGAAADDLFWDLMHPTPLGHALAAGVLEQGLDNAGWPKNRLIASGGVFDTSTIQDQPNPGWFNDGGAGSPQINLFDVSEEVRNESTLAQQKAAEAGPPIPKNLLKPMKTEEMNQPQAVEVWKLSVEVTQGETPISVVVEDQDGRVVGRAKMTRLGQFRLSMRMDVTEGVVKITDASGRTVKANASIAEPSVSLGMGD